MRLTPAYALVVLVMLTANRAPPKWQAFGNVSLDQAAACAKAELGKFGDVSEESGVEPEAGSRRLYLWHEAAKGEPKAVIYLDGELGFSAMWMDAKDASLGESIWHQIKGQCGVA
jgi:hypothetical protein